VGGGVALYLNFLDVQSIVIFLCQTPEAHVLDISDVVFRLQPS